VQWRQGIFSDPGSPSSSTMAEVKSIVLLY
jgi:hypothetical protein